MMSLRYVLLSAACLGVALPAVAQTYPTVQPLGQTRPSEPLPEHLKTRAGNVGGMPAAMAAPAATPAAAPVASMPAEPQALSAAAPQAGYVAPPNDGAPETYIESDDSADGEEIRMQLPAAQEQNGIRYVSGGIGKGERAALEQAAIGQYNLRVDVSEAGGAYIAEPTISIRDAKGAEVLSVVQDGPVLFVALPPGRYVLTAVYEGKSKQANVQVAATGIAKARFFW